jgi:protein SCO1/2
VSARRDRAWLMRYIRVPDEMLAAGDPTASALFKKYKEVRMPNLRLAPGEVRGVISYIDARSKSQPR